MRRILFIILFIWGILSVSGFGQIVSTYASGIFGPVGIEIDSKGWIWVAQAGNGNSDSKISIVTGQDQVYPFIIGLPSEVISSGEIVGTEHIFFSPNGKLLIMQGGPGADSLAQSILVVDTAGFVPGVSAPLNRSAIESVYKVGEFVYNHLDTVSNPYTLTFTPNGDMFITDAAANAIIKHENATKSFSVFALFPDIANNTGIGPPFVNVVPTGIVYKDSRFFVGSLTGFPFANNTASVYEVDTMGTVTDYKTDLTTIVDVTTDRDDNLVVLQHAAFQLPPFMPSSGAVLRISNGMPDTLVTELNRPTSVRFVSNSEFFVSTLTDGKILRIRNAEIPGKGLQLWLKADTGGVLNGTTVGRWMDQSGKGNDAIQSDPDRQPLLVNDELDGKPVLRFDGIDDRLGFTGSKIMNNISLFIVFKNKSGITDIPSNYPGFVLTFSPGGTFTDNQHYVLKMRGLQGTDNIILVNATYNSLPEDFVEATAPNIAKYDEWRNINIVSDSTILNTTMRWNGKDASVVPFGNDTPISFTLGDSIGSGGGLGSRDNWPMLGTIRAKCDVAELIVYDRVLSSADRLSIEHYLNDKYNLGTITGINDPVNKINEGFSLNQNFPNPVLSSTVISYSIPQSSFVSLKIFDFLGREVASLINKEQPEGLYEVEFSRGNLKEGIYYCSLVAGNFSATKKILFLK